MPEFTLFRGSVSETDDVASSTRGSLTSRAAVLALVLAALVMTLAFPVREFVQQRAQLASLQALVDRQQASVTSLQAQRDRWQDPAYVEAQARARLHFVFPGETGYVVLSPGDVARARDPQLRQPELPATPWYDTLWHSVEAADSGR
jgi:cell division protein FtsB